MRKIEELLNNEILLKKTIHELKNQVEGKGGVHQEYDKTIKALKKTQDELQEQLNASLHEN
jgi:cell division septum initiation protein DivIVA